MRKLLCRIFHSHHDLMHPFDGMVRCRRCHMVFAVNWGPPIKPRPVILEDLRNA